MKTIKTITTQTVSFVSTRIDLHILNCSLLANGIQAEQEFLDNTCFSLPELFSDAGEDELLEELLADIA